MKDFLIKLTLVILLAFPSNSVTANTQQFEAKEVRCLAKNIYFEARGEPRKGQEAVALVTLNRVKSPRYPNTICGTVYAKYQFSWTANSKRKITDKTAWARAERIAYAVLSGNHGLGSFKALHFHNKKVAPAWGLKRRAVIGNHIFY